MLFLFSRAILTLIIICCLHQKAAAKWLAKFSKDKFPKDLTDPVNLKEFMNLVYREKTFYSEDPVVRVGLNSFHVCSWNFECAEC